MNPVAKLNDSFRARIGLPDSGRPIAPGAFFITRGIAELPETAQVAILARVRAFCEFGEDNDPWDERDFGAFTLKGLGKFFWKIDYYASSEMWEAAEDPGDPAKSFRVLTIMFADEW